MKHLFILFFFPDTLATRGEKLELLIDKTDDLNSNVSMKQIYDVLHLCQSYEVCFSKNYQFLKFYIYI